MPAGLAVLVPRDRTESVRVKLRDEGLLDPNRRIVDRGGAVALPVRSAPDDVMVGDVVAQDLPAATRTPPPVRSVREMLDLPRDLQDRLPEKWERVGDVVILRIPPELWDVRSDLGRAYCLALRARTALAILGGPVGPMREPRIEHIWGGSAESVHIENAVRFKFDASRVMFSSGNLRERVRMATLPAAGEVVADLFAGIGYFAIPMAVHSRASRVVACEINPVAFSYLLENCRLNRAATVDALLGDCRTVAPKGEADRVVMGYLEGAPYLATGLDALRPEGGWMHYHEACPDASPSVPEARVRAAAERAGFCVAKIETRRLKSYAPRTGHWIVDAELRG